MKKAFIIIGVIIVVGGLGTWLFIKDLKNGVNGNGDLPEIGQEFLDEGREHVPDGTKVEYKTNPPTSGNHYAEPATWGVYQAPLPDEKVVHNLEHGGIWISYKGIDEDTKAKLQDVANHNTGSVILTPREQNDTPIVLASWHYLLKLESFDRDQIELFIKRNINHAPEPLANTFSM